MKKVLLFLFFFFITFINVYAEGLKDLQIDRVTIEGFSSDKLEYNINYPSDRSSILIGYVIEDGYTIQRGVNGDTSLEYGNNPLEIVVKNNETEKEYTYKINITREDNRSSDNSLTSLTVGSNKVVLGDEFEYNVSVDAKLSSVEVKATTADKASFIDGYGERIGSNAVSLTGEKTSFEIRVKAENESIRTYKINVIKTNYLSSDASLKSLTIDEIEFDFKRDTYEYDLSVKYDINKIKINAVPNHDKANVEYTENVNLKSGINNIEIKVTAEDSSVKIYKLNITREEEVPIVSDIKITGIDFEFKPKTYNYKIETTLSELNFNITLRSEEATYEIKNNEDLKNNSRITIEAKDGDDTVTYTFRIINKEEKKEEVVTTTNNSNNNFFEDNEMIISLIVFGIGTLSTLISILLKRKSKVM